MQSPIVDQHKPEFEKSLDHLKSELSTLRTGRAQASLVENIKVEFYGSPAPLMTMAQIAVPEPRMITIQPYDKNLLKDIEKAIQNSNLGINPVNDGNVIRLAIPPMTEERRKELVKVVATMTEKTRVSIRNIREEVVKKIQKLEKDGEMREDDKISAKEELQELVDKYNEEVKNLAEAKEKEILTI